MEISAVNSTANTNTTTNININISINTDTDIKNTTTNSNQLISNLNEDTHLQSHQQKSHQLIIAVNKSLGNSFANNIDIYTNSIENFNDSKITNTANHDTTNINNLTTQDFAPLHRHNWNNGDLAPLNDDLVLDIKDILMRLVVEVTDELSQESTLNEQQSPVQVNNDQQREESLKSHEPSIIEKVCEDPPTAELDRSIVSSDQLQAQHDEDDSREEKTKDIITLRNLEISPPPNAPEELSENDHHSTNSNANNDENPRDKRRRTDSTDTQLNDSTETGGRSKRQRRQTKLFQAGDVQSDYSPEEADSSIS